MAGAGHADRGGGSVVRRDWASRRDLTFGQWLFWAGLAAALAWGLIIEPRLTFLVSAVAVQLGFVAMAAAWMLLTLVSGRWPPCPAEPRAWPRYTILVALHDEAAVTSQLIRRLAALDYPAHQLQAMLLLEADDAATIAAALSADRPDWLEVVIVPEGLPRTKPRALNLGLARATGELITIYDAEDEPHTGQLREAAARFAADTTGRLACLQAPLRIRPGPPGTFRRRFLSRQFAIEYAGLFEVTLPGMTRLGLPFPLGGTSNHFRADALRQVGGWDAWNVTEDADLGFALWRAGWTSSVITCPTWEAAPARLYDWLPQRTRWLKGFMQTWGVHTRDPAGLGWRGALALLLMIGGTLAAAASHAVSLAALVAAALITLVAALPLEPSPALGVLAIGVVSAWISGAVGARRAGVSCTTIDLALAPGGWSLQSLAFLHATYRLVVEPFAWDKTPHEPDEPEASIGDVLPGEGASGEPVADSALRIRRVSL